MDPFERKIRKTLSKAPEREPDQSVWDAIDRKLVPSGKDSRNWIRYAASSGLLLLVGGLIFTTWNNYQRFNRNLQSQIAEMAKEIQDLKNTSIDTIVIRDTIWQIYHSTGMVSNKSFGQEKFDLSNILTSAVQDGIPSYPNSSAFTTSAPPFLSKSPSNRFLDFNKRVLTTTSATTDQLGKKTEYERDLTPIMRIQSRDLQPSNSSRRTIQVHPYRALYAEDIIKANRIRHLGKALWPDQVRIGLLTGALNPLVHEAEHSTEWLVGAQAELLLSSRFSVMAGFRHRYFSTKYEHELEDGKFPAPEGIRPGDRVNEIYLTNRYQEFPVLLKYSLPLAGHFWPYLTTGLLWGNTRSQKFRYEVIRQGDEMDLSITIPPGE